MEAPIFLLVGFVGFIGFYGALWVFVGSYGFLWVLMGFYGAGDTLALRNLQ